MVFKMRRIIHLTFLLLFVFCLSCEKRDFFVRCSECTGTEPDKVDLKIILDPGDYIVEVNVYEGNLEDSILFDQSYVSTAQTVVSVKVNKLYTVTAKYYINGNVYIAVDSARPGVKYEKEQCDNPCYY